MPATIPALVASAAATHGDRTAIADATSSLTFDALRDVSGQFGAALLSSGIEPLDRIAIWAPNSREWVVAFLGLSSVGATLVPINTRFKGLEAADILRRSRARVLVTVTDFLGTDYVHALRASDVDLPDLETVVVAPGGASEGAIPWEAFLDRARPGDRAEVDRRAAAVAEDDVADILFTSGTTGTPKGVVHTHRSTVGIASDWVAMTGLSTADRYLMINPYFHTFGLKAGILASLAAGATMLPEPVFDVERVLERVAHERVTVLPGAPTIYQAILDHPTRSAHDLSSLRVAVTGAADIPVELIRRVLDELPFSTVIAGYGLTEGGTATGTAPRDDPQTIARTVGRPRPGFEVRITDSDGSDLPLGETGEILLRSATTMSHYLDDPEATAEVLSSDGWLRTGDLGALDDAGNLRIAGRSKDMFIVGGFNAYPAEVEGALLRHPDIRQVAVIGVPDERLGEVGMAFVVLRPDASVGPPELIAWAREAMANYKVPRRVELVDELPINAGGKVLKNVLRDRAGGANLISTSTLMPASGQPPRPGEARA